jgi:hypothetical protein
MMNHKSPPLTNLPQKADFAKKPVAPSLTRQLPRFARKDCKNFLNFFENCLTCDGVFDYSKIISNTSEL